MAPFTYTPALLSAEEAAAAFRELWDELDWKNLPGVPRLEYWTNTFGRPYTYGHGPGMRTYEPQPSHSTIVALAERVEQSLGLKPYEGCFLNGYRDSRDSLGWHADDDPAIDHSRPIAVVTLYEDVPQRPRVIQLRAREEASSVETQELEQGSLFTMAAGAQQTHYHRIPKAGFVVPRRISLTFRGLL